MLRRIVSGLILFSLAGPAGIGQAPADEERPTIRTTTREVILDVIARDKHHHAIADLRPEEIEVYEDGVKQKINAFRNVQGAEQLQTEREQAKVPSGPAAASKATSTPAQGPSTGSTALKELNFVSVVFAQIAPLNLEFAREAVLDFLQSDTLPNTYVTVYRLDRTLSVVQPYTADKQSLIAAVNTAAKGLNSKSDIGSAANVVSGNIATIQAQAANILATPQTNAATAQAVISTLMNPVPEILQDPLWARNAAFQDVSVTLNNALIGQAKLAAGERFADSLSSGMDAMDALRQLVRVQAKLPGRKVVLYLADGLSLPMDRRDAVDGVLSYANQMEVAFYAVDTRGLSIDDPMAQPLAEQERTAAESSVNNVSARMGHQEGNDIALTLSSNKQLALQELAEATGGFAVTNTNQIAVPMQRVMEDIRTHYEVAYTPSDTNYDGHFRKIQVRIARPHVTVQTRSGYFALPQINGEPVQPYEMKSLKSIDARPAPADFAYETALLRFRPKPAAVDYEMAFDIPAPNLRIVTDPTTGNGHMRYSIVALIRRKDDGQVIAKFSHDLEREISKENLARVADDHILYAEPIVLPAGQYLIDTAINDELAEKISVKHISANVDPGRDFGVSSLELVRGVQALPGPSNGMDPFETDSGRIVPTLAESMPSGKPLQVYFVVYPTSTSDTTPRITLQLFRNGQEVGSKDLAPPKPRADGSIPCLLRLNPDPGQYDMIIKAQQGTLSSEARLSVTVTPGGAVNAN